MSMNKSSKFLSLLEDFLYYYLPTAKGLSRNTIKSYKYAFRLLIQFMQLNNDILADQITFEQLNYNTLIKYLEWLEEVRGCSKSTRNQRLAALLSFSKYALGKANDLIRLNSISQCCSSDSPTNFVDCFALKSL